MVREFSLSPRRWRDRCLWSRSSGRHPAVHPELHDRSTEKPPSNFFSPFFITPFLFPSKFHDSMLREFHNTFPRFQNEPPLYPRRMFGTHTKRGGCACLRSSTLLWSQFIPRDVRDRYICRGIQLYAHEHAHDIVHATPCILSPRIESRSSK